MVARMPGSVSTTCAAYSGIWGSPSGYEEAITYSEGKGGAERINLQRDDSHAKPCQVRQVRGVIVKYRLEEGKSNDV